MIRTYSVVNTEQFSYNSTFICIFHIIQCSHFMVLVLPDVSFSISSKIFQSHFFSSFLLFIVHHSLRSLVALIRKFFTNFRPTILISRVKMQACTYITFDPELIFPPPFSSSCKWKSLVFAHESSSPLKTMQICKHKQQFKVSPRDNLNNVDLQFDIGVLHCFVLIFLNWITATRVGSEKTTCMKGKIRELSVTKGRRIQYLLRLLVINVEPKGTLVVS